MARDPPELPKCADCPARASGFCGRLPDPLRSRFRTIGRPVAPERLAEESGGAIAGWDIAVVSRGIVAMRRAFEDGRRAITDFMVPGEVLHAREFGGGNGREVTASPSSVLCLFPSLETEFDPADCYCLERYIRADAVGHVEALRDRIAALARLGPRERLAHLLLGLYERLDPEGRTVIIPFSRADISDLLGMRMETISRSLHALERAGLIRRNGPKKIEILDPAGLATVVAG